MSAADAQLLIDLLAPHAGIVVAFSGGVDSSVVAAAAHRAMENRAMENRAMENRAIAVTAVSPSVAQWQIEMAQRVAKEIGMEHRLVETKEWQREDYIRNDSDRCFYCKSTLYESIELIQQQPIAGGWRLASGTNADDLGDHRPGLRAGERAAVMTPLADLGWGKKQVREIARRWGLSNADLPASPCLASRIAYGVSVTPERLKKVERAEEILRDLGFETLRVRLHCSGTLDFASLEVEPERVSELESFVRTTDLLDRLRSIGFAESTVDAEGFRSGKLNDGLTVSQTPPTPLYQLNTGNSR